MVYIDEDFYSTLVGNQRKGNSEQVKEQILNEIADLIAYNKAEVIEALNASGVLTKENASDQKVIDALINNVEKNKKLQAGLGYLITKKQAYSSQDGAPSSGGGVLAGLMGGAEGGAGGAGAGPIGAIIGSIAGAVKGVFDFKAAKTNAQAAADQQRMQLAQMVLARKGGSKNTGLYIGLGVLALAVVVIVIVKTRKK